MKRHKASIPKQVLSQQRISMVRILQMNSQELEQFIIQQEVENPLIDLEKVQEETDRHLEIQRKLEWLKASDEQNRVYYRDEIKEEAEREAWSVSVEDENLADFVMSQLSSVCRNDRDREVLYFMAESLDSHGYLEENLRSICEKFDLSENEASHYLYLLQSAEPTGIGARNLRECLLLQLDRIQPSFPMARRIVLECLEALGKNQISQISSCLGISLEEARMNCDVIRRLNPKPGCGFYSRENLRYIQPDVTIIKFRDYFQVLLNDDAYPKIIINPYYSQMLEDSSYSEETREYIRNKMKQAEWLIRCIQQRGDILVEVIKTILTIQHAFFEKGPGNRYPMRFQEVASRLNLPESMVSRAVQDKYLQCAWGIYPINYFFAQNPGSRDDQVKENTPEMLRENIRLIVDGENKQHPLSDQKITDCLEKMGIMVSRRTVAKYRSIMGIREASGRREFS